MSASGNVWYELFTKFHMHKLVRIHSPHLRVPELVLMTFFIIFFLGYSVFIKLQFLKIEDVDAKIMFQINNPTKNFESCTEIDGDCDQDFHEFSRYPYCNPATLPRRPRVTGCKRFDRYDISRHQYSQEEFVGTLVSDIFELSCMDDREGVASAGETPLVSGGAGQSRGAGPSRARACSQTWNIVNETHHFVAGIEDFVALFVHSFGTHDSAQVYSHSNAQAYITWLREDGRTELRRIPCFGTHCDYNASSGHEEPCGTFSQDRTACYSDREGDYISIDLLLRSANISLDDLHEGDEGGDGVTNRVAGLPLVLEVEYTNYHPWDFWWGLLNGREPLLPKYIYTLKPIPLGKRTNPLDYNKVSYPVSSERRVRRRRHRLYGLLITVVSTGNLGHYSGRAFLVSLSIITTLYTLAHLVVKYVLVSIYDANARFSHIAKLKHLYNYEEGATEAQMYRLSEKAERGDESAFSPQTFKRIRKQAKERQVMALFHFESGSSGSDDDV